MKRMILAGLSAFALLVGGATVLNTTGSNEALAQSASTKAMVDAAKRAGDVGERIDGYLEVVGAGTPALRAAVDEINIGRKAVYRDLARQENVRLEVIAQLTGEKQLAKAAPGERVKGADGEWRTK